MKIAFLLLVFSVCAARSQLVVEQPLRRFGTNVFDLTPVMQSSGQGQFADTRYLVTGTVSRVQGNCAYIVREKIEVRIKPQFQRDLLLAGPGDQLKMLYVMKLLQQTNGISSGEFNVLSPDTKQMYLDAVERVVNYVQIFVTNCPSEYLITGKSARFFAFPSGTHKFVDAENETQSISRFDYGQVFLGDFESVSDLYSVTPRGLVKKDTPLEAKARKATMTANLISWQHEQASNGVAYSQFDLGQRYLNGDGVISNKSIGNFWIQKSAAQNYDPALKLMEQRRDLQPQDAKPQ